MIVIGLGLFFGTGDGVAKAKVRFFAFACGFGFALLVLDDVLDVAAVGGVEFGGDGIVLVVPDSFCCRDFTMSKKRLVPVTVTTTSKKKCFIHGGQQPKQLSRETGPATRSLGAGTEGELRGNCKLPTPCKKLWAQASHHAKKAIVRDRGMCQTGISVVNPLSKCSNPSQIHCQPPKSPLL